MTPGIYEGGCRNASAVHAVRRRAGIFRRVIPAAALAGAIACTSAPPPPAALAAQNLVLITVDTLRADRVGAYGYQAAQTAAFDAVASAGVRFSRAYATAPITLTSHASLLTGRYPPGHGGRHNGIAMNAAVPTLATALDAAGFATGAFVSAFPLDRRFGLERGFDVYDDVIERGPDGRPLNERPGIETARRARQWLDAHRNQRFFLWLHLFDPHAPYGDPASAGTRSVAARYDDDIAAADRAAALVLDGLADKAASTLVVMTSDHGEAFGEHGEIGHSIFVYDTTLRVPLVMRGPGVPEGKALNAPVSLVDVPPTALALLGVTGFDADGINLATVFQNDATSDRTIYAESFAPLFDFGWSPLRSVRDATWKYIAAPKPELYDIVSDGAETRNLESRERQRAAQLLARVERYSPPDASAAQNAEAASRLRALGYLSGGPRSAQSARPDPKDRIALASRIAMVTSGEVRGSELVATLRAILKEDPRNPQANLRLGYAELAENRCAQAEPYFRAAIAGQLPSADAALGLADCRMRANDAAGAERALEIARAAEPGNPVVDANLALVALSRKDTALAIKLLRAALARDPGFLEARFNLARALAIAGERSEALKEAQTLLSQLPAHALQRGEVERLIKALQ
jgi:arylsulfatase A-like enzyme/Flp pilus assembly protein TadD